MAVREGVIFGDDIGFCTGVVDGEGVTVGEEVFVALLVLIPGTTVKTAGVVLIHGMKAATRAYTPGKFASAQPSPNEVRPVSIGLPSELYCIIGPPLSPELSEWNEVQNKMSLLASVVVNECENEDYMEVHALTKHHSRRHRSTLRRSVSFSR